MTMSFAGMDPGQFAAMGAQARQNNAYADAAQALEALKELGVNS